MIEKDAYNMTMNSSTRLVALVAITALAAACSRPAPEERLMQAGEDVVDVESRLTAIKSDIERHESAIQRLKDERERANKTLMTLEERLARRATDLAIFRAAQGALLDDQQLQDAVVLASVEDGVVTLEGSVTSAGEGSKAEAVVAAIPGVEKTVSRLQVLSESDSNGR